MFNTVRTRFSRDYSYVARRATIRNKKFTTRATDSGENK